MTMIIRGQGCVAGVSSVDEAVEYVKEYHGMQAVPTGEFFPVSKSAQVADEWEGWERISLRVEGVDAFGLYRKTVT